MAEMVALAAAQWAEDAEKAHRGWEGVWWIVFISQLCLIFFSSSSVPLDFGGWLLSVTSLRAMGGVAMKLCMCCCLPGLLQREVPNKTRST